MRNWLGAWLKQGVKKQCDETGDPTRIADLAGYLTRLDRSNRPASAVWCRIGVIFAGESAGISASSTNSGPSKIIVLKVLLKAM